MPVVPATVETLVPDQLTVRWGKKAPLDDVEGFLTYLLESDGLGDTLKSGGGPAMEVHVSDHDCTFLPSSDLWSMILAEELAVRLTRAQGGEVVDGAGTQIAVADAEESRPWAALEAVGVMSLFRPRPPDAPDAHAHPLIPLDDCKVSGVDFSDEQECVLDLYFDYWARPCAFLTEKDEEPVLLYRPMYRYRQAIFGPSDRCRVMLRSPPTSRIYGALGVRGYRIAKHSVDPEGLWSIGGQGMAFGLRIRTDDAWLTRSVPLWVRTDPLMLAGLSSREFTVDELLHRKEQHWDITDAQWDQEWYVAANEDGTLNPLGRIYKADPTTALLDLPGLKPKKP